MNEAIERLNEAELEAVREQLRAAHKAGKIGHVYNGRVNRCCCGCSGKHTYADAEKGAARRGYAVEPEEVSSRTISIVVGKILRSPDLRYDNAYAPHFIAERGGRMYVAYVTE